MGLSHQGEFGYLVDDSCTACGACLLTCPEHAFVVGIPLQVRADRCTDCGECIEICPADAISRVPELIRPALTRPARVGSA